jgi:hypothetical protein
VFVGRRTEAHRMALTMEMAGLLVRATCFSLCLSVCRSDKEG